MGDYWEQYKNLILDFLAANWTDFEAHCEESQEQADEVYNNLEK